MAIIKAKALVPHMTDDQIKNGCHAVKFMSFESAIQMFRQQYGLMELREAPMGYRVTDQGIEMIQQ